MEGARVSVDVALDLPRMRHMSVGMTAYAEELARRLPRVANDLSFATLVRSSALDRDEQFGLPARLRSMRPRLVHHLSVYAPLAGPRPFVITIHDLIHLRFPQYFKGRVGPYYRTIVRAVCARAARVITDDEATVADLERYLGVSARKVRVVSLGVDEAFLGEVDPYAAERPYFFYAGNRKPHKNLATLLGAWAALPAHYDVDLVLSGRANGESLPDVARERGRVRDAGELTAAELARRYRGSAALVYPSLCEGFGLPMLEAAAVGARVIASDAAVPGVLRPLAETFAPFDVARLTPLMVRALDAPSDRSAARAVARDLTWDRCARATAEVYRDVLVESRGR